MRKFKAVLFDLDGTLVRTMGAHFEAWRKACRDFGFEITKEDFFPLEGTNLLEGARIFCIKYGVEEKYAESIVEHKKNYFLKIFSNARPEFYPAVEKIITLLYAKKLPLGIVTASLKEQVKASLPGEFLENFSAVVTGEMIGQGKPHPDPYLKSAEFLRVDPKDCVAVENAPLGIKSAKSAGMYCVALAHTVSRDKLNEADVVLGVFEELSKFFHDIGI